MIRRLLGGRAERRSLSFADIWGRGLDMTTNRTVSGEVVTYDAALTLSSVYAAIRLLSASIDGTAFTAQEKTDTALFEDGTMQRKSGIWTYTNPGGKVIVEYEAGVGTVAASDIRWAARTLARYHLVEQWSRIPDRAISLSSEFGNIQLAQPGMNRPTPLPDVNVVLNRHRHRAPTAF